MHKQLIPARSTSRGQLRLLRASDLPYTLEWRNQENARKWFRYDKLLTLEQHNKWFAEYALKNDDFTFVFEVDSKPIGQFAIYNLDRVNQRAEVGRILLDPSSQGKGYATEALIGLVQIAEIDLSCNCIWLEVKSENSKAIRVYEACGFTPVNDDSGYVRMEIECRSVTQKKQIA